MRKGDLDLARTGRQVVWWKKRKSDGLGSDTRGLIPVILMSGWIPDANGRGEPNYILIREYEKPTQKPFRVNMQVLKVMTKEQEQDYKLPAQPPLLRKDLVDRFCMGRDDVTKKDAMWWFRSYEKTIEAALMEGREVRLVSFGTFHRRWYTKRQARNIQTGELFITSSVPRVALVWAKRIREAFKSTNDA
ncbi:MAG: HU family DNA-binding protein [Plesiomonas shigelloides]